MKKEFTIHYKNQPLKVNVENDDRFRVTYPDGHMRMLLAAAGEDGEAYFIFESNNNEFVEPDAGDLEALEIGELIKKATG